MSNEISFNLMKENENLKKRVKVWEEETPHNESRWWRKLEKNMTTMYLLNLMILEMDSIIMVLKIFRQPVGK